GGSLAGPPGPKPRRGALGVQPRGVPEVPPPPGPRRAGHGPRDAEAVHRRRLRPGLPVRRGGGPGQGRGAQTRGAGADAAGGGGGELVNNTNVMVDQPETPKPPPQGDSPAPQRARQGNTVPYAHRRLFRDRPDLFERVRQGELSAHAAMVEAGFRKVPTPLDV